VHCTEPVRLLFADEFCWVQPLTKITETKRTASKRICSFILKHRFWMLNNIFFVARVVENN